MFGGMQDFIYLAGHCLEITLELWEDKAPAATLLSALWDENRKAMLQLPARALLGGLLGTVMQAPAEAGGVPRSIADAVVMIDGMPLPTPMPRYHRNP